ncbi:MAG TPA: ammonium transporter [Sedimenticola sp.]|nr:ammonium transporter [Sedimenticola sp.]
MIKAARRFLVFTFLLCGYGATAYAGDSAPVIDGADTAWILVSSAFVMLMVPGLAFFYGGMVRRKNVLNTIMYSFTALAVISIQWAIMGYSLAFAPDVGGFIGSLKWLGLSGVGAEPGDYADTIPHGAFMIFQMMFAIITPALISGAVAERMKFSAYVVFIAIWSTIVYDPICHWVWGGGWIGDLGALDFAGGTVVHISSGVSALAAAMVLGKRKGYGRDHMPPHNLPMTLLGAGLLWFGWFGFNAGSALSSGALASSAFVATQIATAAAILGWVWIEWKQRGKPTALGAASGAIAGLVAITPAAGFVGPMSSILIGFGAGIVCYMAVSLIKPMLGYDDSLDAFGIHGVGGAWGALATGLFASLSVNPGGADGLFFGDAGLLWKQIVSILGTGIYAFVVTYVLLIILDSVIGLRVTEEEEQMGIDLSEHGEAGYTN